METIIAGSVFDDKVWCELDVEGEDGLVVRARYLNDTMREGRVVIRREGGSRWELRLYPASETQVVEIPALERPISSGRRLDFEWPRAGNW